MDLKEAITAFQHILDDIDSTGKTEFLHWLKTKFDNSNWDDVLSSTRNEDKMLENIRDDIREVLPLTAISKTEHILNSQVGPNADCDPSITVHVDGFLYDDCAVDDLADEGKLSRNFCTKCGSRDVQPLSFISHSTSIKQIKYIYQYLLPDLNNKIILDVGSRTGCLLYGAFLYSNASRIIGVEIDPSFSQLQTKLVEKYGMTERIQIIEDDIQNQRLLLNSCDVVVLNNVFEFFMSPADQESIWSFIRSNYNKKGSLIISSPSLEESLQHLQTDIDVQSWVTCLNNPDILKTANFHLYGSDENNDSDLEELHIYQVIG